MNWRVQHQRNRNSSIDFAAGWPVASKSVSSCGLIMQHGQPMLNRNGRWMLKNCWPAPSLKPMSNLRNRGQQMRSMHSDSSFALSRGMASAWVRKCLSHSVGMGPVGGSAP